MSSVSRKMADAFDVLGQYGAFLSKFKIPILTGLVMCNTDVNSTVCLERRKERKSGRAEEREKEIGFLWSRKCCVYMYLYA